MQITAQKLKDLDYGSNGAGQDLREFYQSRFPLKSHPNGVSLPEFWEEYGATDNFFHSSLVWLSAVLLSPPDKTALAMRYAGQAMRYATNGEFGDGVTAKNVGVMRGFLADMLASKPRTTSTAVYAPFWADCSVECAQKLADGKGVTFQKQVALAVESARMAREACHQAHNKLNRFPNPAITAVAACLSEQSQWAREALEKAGVWA